MRLHFSRALRLALNRALAGVFLIVSATSSFAQAISELAKNLDPTFVTSLINPANLEGALTYAASATQAADIESAIGAFERLLFYNPMLSRVRFELGVLYFRLGSYEQARGYFRSALEMPDVTPELQARAEQFIAAIDKKLLPDQFSGFVQSGVRYQTNAALGPSPQAILASGRTFNSRFFAHPDWNWFGAFRLDYVHDFGTQNGDTFEASLIGYDAQQFSLHEFDLGLLELRAGPRFAFPGFLNDTSLKPYAVLAGSLLADTPYSGSAGGGLTIHVAAGDVVFDPYAEIVAQHYEPSTLYPLAAGLSGTLQTYALQASGPVAPSMYWQTRLAFAHDNDLFLPYSYDAYSADIWLPWYFPAPWGGRKWALTPSFGLTDWVYAAPDPTINPAVAQRSLEYRAALGIDIPVLNQFSLVVLVQYYAIVSNLAIFSMRDLAVSIAPTLKF